MPANSNLALQSYGYSVAFYKLGVGAGEDIPKLLRTSQLGFRALGAFDFVTIDKIDHLGDSKHRLIDKSLQCVQIRTLLAIHQPELPANLLSWLDGCALSAFVSLELDKSLYSFEKPFVVWSRVNKLIRETNSQELEHISLFPSLGEAEICAVLNVTSFDHVFRVLHRLRALKFSDLYGPDFPEGKDGAVFSNSSTIPLVPISRSGQEDSDKIITGSVEPTIVIGCPPSYDSFVTNYFFDNGGKAKSLLGYDDIVIDFDKPIETKRFLTLLHGFRDKSPTEYIIRSSTFIKGVFSNSLEHENYTLHPFEPDYSIESGFEEGFPNLANRISEISSRIYSSLESRKGFPKIIDMIPVPRILAAHANKMFEYHSRGDEEQVRSIEGELTELLEYSEMGFSHRIDNEFIYSSGARLPDDYTDGTQHCIWAINTMIRFIYRSWGSVSGIDVEELDWQGFIFFSDTLGFRFLSGEILSLPSSAIVLPISKENNWLTLTHELSHSMWFRMNIDQNFSEQLLRIQQSYLPDYDGKQLVADSEHVKDVIFELFANWFDYYHFYDGDFEFFNKAIWSSWLNLPTVVRDPAAYLMRSFFVFLASKYQNDVEVWMMEIEKYEGNEAEFFSQDWNEYRSIFIVQFPERLDSELNDPDIVSEIRDEIYILFGECLKLFQANASDPFRDSINRTPGNIDGEISRIKNGEVIQDDIENPFKLVRGLYRAVLFDHYDIKMSSTAALIMSLSNNQFVTDE